MPSRRLPRPTISRFRRARVADVQAFVERLDFDAPLDPVDAIRFAVEGMSRYAVNIRSPRYFGSFPISANAGYAVSQLNACSMSPLERLTGRPHLHRNTSSGTAGDPSGDYELPDKSSRHRRPRQSPRVRPPFAPAGRVIATSRGARGTYSCRSLAHRDCVHTASHEIRASCIRESTAEAALPSTAVAAISSPRP
jgi:hypothetical protein